MFRNLFGGSAAAHSKDAQKRSSNSGPRVPRHSSAWGTLARELQATSGLRILDIGAISPSTVSLLTDMGHSVYLADWVADANSEEYFLPSLEGSTAKRYDTSRFVTQNLDISGREFDLVLFWDTADYLPPPLVPVIIDQLYTAMAPGAKLLAFFHSGEQGPETAFCRYHITRGDMVEIQPGPVHPIQSVYSNRTIEHLFRAFTSTKFFLARDKIREVLVTR